MANIQIDDKIFQPYITQSEIASAVERVATELNQTFAGRNPLMVCLLKGGVFFFVDVLRHLNFPVEMDFLTISSYSGTQQGELALYADIQVSPAGREVVLFDDVADSGATLKFAVEHLKNRGAQSVYTATMFYKPRKLASDASLDFYGLEVGDEFIVGYGLDYHNKGRTFPEVYKTSR
ncbi:MAG: phosphoribosyltransferase family protein [Planctomycetia bacterium]|nr:phosphoribosyltransferase family protein [Planctomycetia bacterium]